MKSHEVYGSCGADGHYINIIYCSWRRQIFSSANSRHLGCRKRHVDKFGCYKKKWLCLLPWKYLFEAHLNFFFCLFQKGLLKTKLILSCSKKKTFSDFSRIEEVPLFSAQAVWVSAHCLWTGFPFGEQELEEVVWSEMVQISLKKFLLRVHCKSDFVLDNVMGTQYEWESQWFLCSLERILEPKGTCTSMFTEVLSIIGIYQQETGKINYEIPIQWKIIHYL